jgi:tRNA(fMet)-specific endonuclease VapC
VQEFSDRLEDIVPWDRDAVDAYTRIQLQAMEAGHTLNMNDAMVAAHALSLEAKLLTQNRKQFDSIPGLEILDLPA